MVVSFDGPADSKTIAVGQRYVQQDQIKVLLCCQIQCSLLARRTLYPIPFPSQVFRQIFHNAGVILHQQNLCHGGSTPFYLPDYTC